MDTLSHHSRPQSSNPYSRGHGRSLVFSAQTSKQQILDVIDKLNEKDLQKVVDKVIEIKVEQANQEALNTTIPENEDGPEAALPQTEEQKQLDAI